MKHLLIILFALWGANVTAQTPQCVQNNLNSYLSLNGQEIKSETWCQGQ